MRNARILAALAPIALAATLTACGKPSGSPPDGPGAAPSAQRAVATTVVEVAQRDFSTRTTLDAEVANLYSPDVASEVAGKVVFTAVEPGDQVKKGQLLARIDATDVQLAAASDAADAAALGASAADKLANARRMASLYEQQLVSQADYGSAGAAAKAAQEAYKAAAARAAGSSRNVQKAEVRAPFDGQVAERPVSLGSYVKAGDTVASLVRPDHSYLKASAPESVATWLKVGQAVQVRLPGTQAATPSTISAIRPRANATSRTVEVSVALPMAGPSTWRPGTSAQVTLVTREQQALGVPETALLSEGEKSFVYVVEGGTAHKKVVAVGERAGGFAAVNEGLAAGQKVAKDAAFLFDGARIETGGAQ